MKTAAAPKGQAFRTPAAFEAWMRANHARRTEIWVRIYKKASAKPTVTAPEALEVALCWGWIDGVRKGLDSESFLQRYSPRRARSAWSQINRDHVARLTAAGRMQPPGQRQVDAAKADGRWEAAYAPMRTASVASVPVAPGIPAPPPATTREGRRPAGRRPPAGGPSTSRRRASTASPPPRARRR